MRDLPVTNPFRFRFPLGLLLLGATSIAALYFGFLFFRPLTAGVIVKRYGYVVMFGTVALFAVYGFRLWRSSPKASVMAPRWAWFTILVAWLVVLTADPCRFKVVYDEYDLQATAMNMHFNRDVAVLVRAYKIDGVFMTLDGYLDKRPYFFPFVLSLVHGLLGYRPYNAFILNGILTLVAMVLIFSVTRRLSGAVAGVFAVLLIATLPLFAQNASGSGMEMLNIVMILLSAICGALWLETRSSVRLSVFCLSSVLLAETRYESVLFVPAAFLIIFLGWRKERRVILNPVLILTPLLMVPYALQNLMLSNTKIFWELPENLDSRFSFSHVAQNLTHAWHFLFNFDKGLASSWWLSLVGVIGAVGIFIELAVRRRFRIGDWSSVLIIFAAVILTNLTVLMFYFWGALDDVIVSRLGLPLLVFLGIASAVWVGRLDWRVASRFGIVATIAYAFVFVFPAFAHHFYTAHNVLVREIEWEENLVDSRPGGSRLIITNKSCLTWLIKKTPSLLTDRARLRADALRYHLQQKTFTEILVSQRLRPTTAEGDFEIDKHDALPPNFILQPIALHRFGATLDRISRLVEVTELKRENESEAVEFINPVDRGLVTVSD